MTFSGAPYQQEMNIFCVYLLQFDDVSAST